VLMKVVRDLGPNSVTLIVHSSVNSSVNSSLWRDKRAQGTAKVDTSMNAIRICRHPKCARFCTAFFYRQWRLPRFALKQYSALESCAANRLSFAMALTLLSRPSVWRFQLLTDGISVALSFRLPPSVN